MAAKRSAGILLFRRTNEEILLGHMGGPLWARRDAGAWSIPKGEYEPDEPARDAARREFTEELGLPVPPGELIDLGSARQSAGKEVTIWALEGDLDPAEMTPGTFEMEWPRGSGNQRQFPEIDRVQWFDIDSARPKVIKGQLAFLDRLQALLSGIA
jgi:predicted NUDIX family NTP pyrophosphohydrolase